MFRLADSCQRLLDVVRFPRDNKGALLFRFWDSVQSKRFLGQVIRFALLVYFVSAAGWCCRPVRANTDAPNIVLIIVDDQSWNGTSVKMDPNIVGSRSNFHQTPTLERLAAEGMRFSSAYTSPVCVPTQMALQTGKSWTQLQRTDNFDTAGANFPMMQPVLSTDPGRDPAVMGKEVSIAQRVLEANPEYQTAYFGKYTWELKNWGWYDEGSALSDLPIEVDPKRMFSFTDKSNNFMEASVNAGKPFFTTIMHNATKGPFEALPATVEKWQNATPNGDVGGADHHHPEYAAMTEDLDTSIGMVLDKIEELGIEDNTYIIYTSDNGRQENTIAQFNSYPLRGGKGTLYEGGVRVPLVIKGPGIAPNTISSEPTIVMDLLPTITELTGNPYPLQEEIEGASLVPILENGGVLPQGMDSLSRPYGENGEMFFHYTRPISPSSAVIDGDYKLIRFYHPGGNDVLELYNLADDLSESNNLAASMGGKVAELSQKIENWLQGVDASKSYDVQAPLELLWNGDHLGKSEDVGLSLLKASLGTDRPQSDLNSDGIVDHQDLSIKLAEGPGTWRSTVDVDYKYREMWRLGEGAAQPQHIVAESHQPNLPRQAFQFDGDDEMESLFFHSTNHLKTDTFENNASFEFWFRLDSTDQDQLLFETGDESQGLSLSIGDSDGDGEHNDIRLRAKDDNGDYITVTTALDEFADPTQDFIQLTAVINDEADNRYAEIYVNGALFARVDGALGTDGYIDWDGPDASGLGSIAGVGFGGNSGAGDLPFLGNFSGEVASIRFNNYTIDGSTIKSRYNEVLAPVDYGIAAIAGNVGVPTARPSNVSLSESESSAVQVIQERNDTLFESIAVDALIGDPALLDAASPGAAGVIESGTEFTSYLLQFDPAGSNDLATETVNGTVEFERDILALILGDTLLATTDSLLGSIGDYGDLADRGLELAGDDFLLISADQRTLSFSLSVPGDQLLQFRVITDQMIPGDFNGDGEVDFADLAIWQNSYGIDTSGDTDDDGDTDGADFLAFQRQFTGGQSSFAASNSKVPEPTTLSLTAFLCVVGYVCARGYRFD